jgi:hypothetical protein
MNHRDTSSKADVLVLMAATMVANATSCVSFSLLGGWHCGWCMCVV